jgi:hypothetical protein
VIEEIVEGKIQADFTDTGYDIKKGCSVTR